MTLLYFMRLKKRKVIRGRIRAEKGRCKGNARKVSKQEEVKQSK